MWSACLRTTCAQTAVPDTAIAWKPGYLDIWHFETGRGNSAFFLLPDGTTMLVDAGGIGDSLSGQTLHITPVYPDNSRSPGEWIACYITQLMRSPHLDYTLITHFHADHYGAIRKLADLIPIHHLVDRNYPVYDYPVDLRARYGNDPLFNAYLQLTSHILTDSLQVGSISQLRLLHHPGDYPNFRILGLKNNGTLWKKGQLFSSHEIVSDGWFNENQLSIAIKVSYGPFDYYTGGDNTGLQNEDTPSWFDTETPLADIVGKVDACTFDHHGNRDAMNSYFLRKLSPRVLIAQTWCSDQPGQEVTHRLLSPQVISKPHDAFATCIQPETVVAYGSILVNAFKSLQGHVLLRVFPGGKQYIVIIVTTVDGKLVPRQWFGPYQAE